ncbi:hypothetical protein ACS0TY_034008 [Phlomoides rotata]
MDIILDALLWFSAAAFCLLFLCPLLFSKNLHDVSVEDGGIHCFSLIVVSGERSNNSCRQFGGGMKRNLDDNIIENVMKHKSSRYGVESAWLGSSWTCRKRRTHYQSFCRNSAVISAQEFVYVLAEEGKRLVAYLDDMYEDTKGNKMVVVRWFHKIDEVGFVLPQNYNDREIFFSLCLQDLNLECIDGIATVLSPEHYEKLTNEATHMGLMPFVCSKLFDNDDLKLFDITRIKGYWKQEIFKNNASLLESFCDDLKAKGCFGATVGFKPNKKIRWSKEGDLHLKSPDKVESVDTSLQQVYDGASLDCEVGMKKCKESSSDVSLSVQDNAIPKPVEFLVIGSEIEVLSQDSGIRGCWFRASIIKKHKEKVKVQYIDLKDALDDSKCLEEWILASRVAAPDAFGIRSSGRTIVRPCRLLSDESNVSGVVNVGSVVDAWWHDGWWEGIVVEKESEDKLNVYFPAEKNEFVFSSGDLRQSKEWINDGWQNINPRPDLVSALNGKNQIPDVKQDGLQFDEKDLPAPIKVYASPQLVIKISDSVLENHNKTPKESPAQGVRDLSKDCLLARLRWKASGKRSRGRSPVHKGQFGNNRSSVEARLQTFEKLLVSSSLKLDRDNCKYANDSHFNSSVVPSLVMSR